MLNRPSKYDEKTQSKLLVRAGSSGSVNRRRRRSPVRTYNLRVFSMADFAGLDLLFLLGQAKRKEEIIFFFSNKKVSGDTINYHLIPHKVYK